jgi:peptide/nickel transport system substrate-binding protein
MQKLGLNVEMRMTDLATAFQLRQSQAPADKGGWSMYASYRGSSVNANPVVDVLMRGLGANGFVRNFDDPTLEAMIDEWCVIEDESARIAQTNKIQDRLVEMMPTVPLGSIKQQTAFRSDLKDYIPTNVPVMWNIKRA